MYVGFYNFYEVFNKNRMFLKRSGPLGDNMAYPTVRLGEFLRGKGHRVNTIDTDRLEKFGAVVFFDFPTLKNKYFKELLRKRFDNLYLFLFESELHRPDNFDFRNHKYFKKVFTWHDALVDNKRYFKINFVQNDFNGARLSELRKEKFCTMVASNKFVKHSLQIYSERINAIRWFEQNHPEAFDLYGVGWDEYTFKGPKIIRALNRIRPLKKMLGARYPSYRGRIKNKRDILEKYKFAICYENAAGIPGYITEKIFDSFFAGCIPVYLGAPNISEHIPDNTFIDKRCFNSYEKLYDFMAGLNPVQYRQYLMNIEGFLKSDKFHQFSCDYFNNIILKEVVNSA